MQIVINTDAETTIRIDEGAPPEGPSKEDVEGSPEDRFDETAARDAGGPPAAMIEPAGQPGDVPSGGSGGSSGPTTPDGSTDLRSGGAFREPDST